MQIGSYKIKNETIQTPRSQSGVPSILLIINEVKQVNVKTNI